MTVRMIRHGLAPIDRAASMTPGSMAMRFCSTRRATAKDAAMTMTKIAASVPMVLPTAILVSGPTAVTRMMNGIGRTKFTARFSSVCSGPDGSTPVERDTYSSTPSARPMRPPMIMVRPTIHSVSPNASHMRGPSWSQLVSRARISVVAAAVMVVVALIG